LAKDNIFAVQTPLGFAVRVTNTYWDIIISTKHPVMRGKESKVKEALENPDQIRKSKSDPNVFLFYNKEKDKRWTCAIAKRVKGDEGFLITTYPTDSIKEGEVIWKK